MLRSLNSLMVFAICSLGLAACGLNGSDPDPTLTTLKLNRLASGDLEYCDASGECHTLPYDGDCAVIEIDVDTQTGATCERCILPEGDVLDQGCQDTHIGCVLVTLPEPDCVVCAYVNGAIVFSTCTVEEPQCFNDRDCLSDDGLPGFCVEGQCVFAQGCVSNADCPPGFVCDLPIFADEPAANDRAAGDPAQPGSGAMPPEVIVGSCVPREIPCASDLDCPAEMFCESWCYGAEMDCAGEEGFDCLPPPCEGVCRPFHDNPCEGVDCPAGQHCEVEEVFCFAFPCEPIPVCVPDPTRCETDRDCGEGSVCQLDLCPLGCTIDWCPPCFGVCVPVDPMSCTSDEDCPAGEICSWEVLSGGSAGSSGDPVEPMPGLWAPGICVPAPLTCVNDRDCQSAGELGYCINGVCTGQVDCDIGHAYCPAVPPTCAPGLVLSIDGGCFGPCVDPAACAPAVIECDATADCPPGLACMQYCTACDASLEMCDMACGGVCVPSFAGCFSDLECVDANGAAGWCWDGLCVFDAP